MVELFTPNCSARMTRKFLSLGLSSTVAFSEAVAQPALSRTEPATRSIPSTPSCPNCTFELKHIATLGHADDELPLRKEARPYRDARGRYYAWTTERGKFAVFDSSGKLMRYVGRRGGGPGEFWQNYTPIVGQPDNTLAVFQPNGIHILSPDYAFVRLVPVPTGQVLGDVMSIDQEHILVSSTIATRELAGIPLHIVGQDGHVGPSFGTTTGAYDPLQCRGCTMRFLSRAEASNEVWVGSFASYVLERWTTSGQLKERLSFSGSNWFPAEIGRRAEAGEIRLNGTSPVLRGIWRTPDGLLFVLGSASASGVVRQERNSPRSAVLEPRQPASSAGDDRRVTVLEAVDLARGRVVATQRITAPPFFWHLKNDLLYTTREDADGNSYFDIWRVSLKQPLL